jgi:Protein of unknown function (DUF3306)
MTGPANFILRWARLKREADTGRAEASALPQTDAAADQAFDPASLPSIEAITAGTDIRGFLQSCVPSDLTRAALRQAWASDPAIRDFIGIAENQWDFNDPDALPGFGPLSVEDGASALLAQALGRRDEPNEAIAEMPISTEPPLSATTDHKPAVFEQADQQTFDGPPSTGDVRSLPDGGSGGDTTTDGDRMTERDGLPRVHRHGSALPR